MNNTNLFNYIKIALLISALLVITIVVINLTVNNQKGHLTPYSLSVLKEKNGWYYEVSLNDKLLIKQLYIPAVKGNQYFRSKKDAKKVGELMIHKLKNKKTPTITYNDLKENNITFE